MRTATPKSLRTARERRDQGSVFVEAMIAAAIVAMALGGTFKVIVDGAHRDRAAEARRAALLVAQSQLAATGAEIPLQTGQTAGSSGEYTWRVDVSPYADGVDASAAGRLWRVTVSVAPKGDGPELVALDTLRLGSAAR